MDKYIEVLTPNVAGVLDELDDFQDSITDLVAIGLDDDKVVFIGDTGLLPDQIRELLQIIIARYVDG